MPIGSCSFSATLLSVESSAAATGRRMPLVPLTEDSTPPTDRPRGLRRKISLLHLALIRPMIEEQTIGSDAASIIFDCDSTHSRYIKELSESETTCQICGRDYARSVISRSTSATGLDVMITVDSNIFPMSVPFGWANLNLRSNMARIIVPSMRANREPMHPRGPREKGMKPFWSNGLLEVVALELRSSNREGLNVSGWS